MYDKYRVTGKSFWQFTVHVFCMHVYLHTYVFKIRTFVHLFYHSLKVLGKSPRRVDMQNCYHYDWNGKRIVRWCHRNPNIYKNFERKSHWRKLFMIIVWERYCNASPKPEFFLFSLFIFSFISQLIWVRLGWNFHRWFSIQKHVNWCILILSLCSFAQANTLIHYL